MFSDDEYSLNKLIHVGHRVLQTTGKGEIQPINWLDMFNKALTKGNYNEKVSTQLQVMSLRLALTDPMKEFQMTKGALVPANQHFSWAAAYAMYGAPWKNRDRWKDKEEIKKHARMSPVTEVHTYTKPPETVENPYFPKGSVKTSKKPVRLSTVARKHKIRRHMPQSSRSLSRRVDSSDVIVGDRVCKGICYSDGSAIGVRHAHMSNKTSDLIH